MALEDIGEGDNSLLCACCRPLYNGTNESAKGNWYFPNGTRVFSDDKQSDFYRTRGQMVVRLNRRRGGEDGIYRCEITDSMNVDWTIYIGVYTASNGEWYMYTSVLQCLHAFQKSGSHIAPLCIVKKVDYLTKYLKNVCV